MVVFLSNTTDKARDNLSQLIANGQALEVDYGIQIYDVTVLSEISNPGALIIGDDFNLVAVRRSEYDKLYVES